MSLENAIRKIINNNAGLSASYSKAVDGGFGGPDGGGDPWRDWREERWNSYRLPGDFFPVGDNPEWRWPTRPQDGRISDPNFIEERLWYHGGNVYSWFRCDDIPTGQARFIKADGTVSRAGEEPAKHICPTCSADLCECLNVINNYDYAYMPCFGGRVANPRHPGSPDVPAAAVGPEMFDYVLRTYTRKPIRQMPERCKKYLGGYDRELRYGLNIGSLPGWVATSMLYEGPYVHDLRYAWGIGSSPTSVALSYLNLLQTVGGENPELDGVDLSPFVSSSNRLFPLSQQGINRVLDYLERGSSSFHHSQYELFKDLLLARCRLKDPGGACCSPANLGGFSCEDVLRESDCAGQFHPGETCENIDGDNCGTDKNDKISVTPNAVDPRGINEQTEVLVTQLSKALIKSLRGKK